MQHTSPAALDLLTALVKSVYNDAVEHGLYEGDTLSRITNTDTYVRRRLALLIREEVCELWDAAHAPIHYAEELADVVIMCMSAAGHMGIDLADAIERKIAKNHTRPYKHGKP